MPCYHPIPAWRARRVNQDTGKRPVAFNINDGFKDMPIDLPCGTCIGCRLGKAQDWATRCVHEARLHKDSCFATLTYDQEHINDAQSLSLWDLQRFWKRLRKHLGVKTIRYFACGEYGEQTGRPHYHACIFGYWPSDAQRMRVTPSGHIHYRSEELAKIWGHGFVSITALTEATAAYTASYTLKKYREDGTKVDYQGRREPFLTMSRRPGLGESHAKTHAKYITDFDGIRVRGGKLQRIPRYYETVIQREQPQLMRGLKTRRKQKALHNPDNTGSRLIIREQVKKANTTHLAARNGKL